MNGQISWALVKVFNDIHLKHREWQNYSLSISGSQWHNWHGRPQHITRPTGKLGLWHSAKLVWFPPPSPLNCLVTKMCYRNNLSLPHTHTKYNKKHILLCLMSRNIYLYMFAESGGVRSRFWCQECSGFHLQSEYYWPVMSEQQVGLCGEAERTGWKTNSEPVDYHLIMI